MHTRRFALALALILFPLVQPAVSFPARTEPDYKCISVGKSGGESRRVNGFFVQVLSLRSARDSAARCQATVRDANGKVIFSRVDSGAAILSITGKDVNGDGQPDAVFEAWSGGAHCCYTYWIVSLGDRPGLIREIYNNDPIKFRDLKRDGRIELVTTDGAFDYFDDLSFGYSPFVEVIMRLEGKKLFPVGPEFWPRYNRVIRDKMVDLQPDVLREFRIARREDFHGDWEETKSNIFLVALCYLYGGRENEAVRFLISVYGPKDGPDMEKKLLKQAQSSFLGDTKDPNFGSRESCE
jgi:hypothetical protein